MTEGSLEACHAGRANSRGPAECLALAATPTFAAMALATCLLGGRAPHMLCLVPRSGFSLGGMVPMYLLMSAFHAAPWLKLISARR